MGGVLLDSFLDRLGLEDGDQRFCVWFAFVSMEGEEVLPGGWVMDCLGWVAAVQEGKMNLGTFCNNLREFLEKPGAMLASEWLGAVANCMLSGHTEPDAEPCT